MASGPVLCTLTKVEVMHHTTTELEALKDSGEEKSLMDRGLVKELGLGSER